jgi:hypothetical protein
MQKTRHVKKNNLVAKHSRHCRGGFHKNKRRLARLIRGQKKSASMALYYFWAIPFLQSSVKSSALTLARINFMQVRTRDFRDF